MAMSKGKNEKWQVRREMTMVELKDGDIVTLVHYAGFNKVYVMPILKDGELIHLADDIKLCQLKQAPMTMAAPPLTGDIILTKYRMNGLASDYYRAVVCGVHPDKGRIFVRILDGGEQVYVDIADCKLADEAILKHPVYVRRVMLHGIPDMQHELMMSRVAKYFGMIKNKKLTLKIEVKPTDEESTPMVFVKLYFGKGAQQQECVNDGILALGTWFWEKCFLCGNTTGEEICKEMGTKAVLLHEIPIQKVVLHEEIPVKIVKFNSANLVIVVPQLSMYLHDFRVFEGQIQKYAEAVAADPYFPELDEVVLMRTFVGSSYSIWKRAARIWLNNENMLYCMDYGDMFPFGFCEVRRIPLEFTLVGTFALYADLNVTPMDRISDGQLAAALKKILLADSVHSMKGESIDKSTAVITFTVVNLHEKLLHAMYG